MNDTPVTDFEKKTLEEFVKEYKGTLVDNKEPWYLVHEATAKKLERERDAALEQLESTKRRMKVERTAARQAIDDAETERDKAYEQFYQNPDAAKHEREKSEKQNAEWKRKMDFASNAFAQSIKKIEELKREIDEARDQNAKLRELAERAIGYLRNSYRDSFKDEENELRAELDQLKEGAK